MPIPSTPLSQHIDETVQQFGESVEDPEEEEEQMMLVTLWRLGHDLEAVFLLVPGESVIHPPQNGPLPRVANSLHEGQD